MREQASFTVRGRCSARLPGTRDEGGAGAPGEGVASSCEAGATCASIPQITVHVNSVEQARAAIEEGADVIYLTGDVFQPDRPFGREDIEALTADKGNAEMILGMPRMMNERIWSSTIISRRGKQHKFYGLDGLLASNIGAMHKFQSLGRR